MADTLFTFDDEQVVNDGPVTCLGIQFENDAKRKEFFRDELRKKLPELRLIEGFPIGSDDDIVGLSDPPYYTACPNPWIKDFIREWEAEKAQLLADKKRTADFDVKEPYSADVSEGKSNPIYMAHSYHTKVPHTAIMRYLLHYTQPGDIVFDGFAGTGMTGVAAGMCEDGLDDVKCKKGVRHCICGDLSPIASFITYNFNNPQSDRAFKASFKKIIDSSKHEYGHLYNTKHTNGDTGTISYVLWSEVFTCPDCGSEVVFYAPKESSNLDLSYEHNCPNCGAHHTKKTLKKYYETVVGSTGDTLVCNKIIPVLIKYNYRGKGFYKIPDNDDLKLLNEINNLEIKTSIPNFKIEPGVKTNELIKNGRLFVSDLYTRRNLIVFSDLWKRAENSPLVRFAITAILVKTGSLLHNVGFKNGKLNLAGALPNALFIPSVIAERSVYELLEGKYNDIVRMEPESLHRICNQIQSATDLSNIPDNSIDYIFTDPPFGDNLMYSELNFIHESWLRLLTNNKEEAIKNSVQNKGVFDYEELMQKSFAEYHRILKPGRWMTVEFSNTSAAVWNAIQQAITAAGFSISVVRGLDKQQGSFNAQTTTTAVKQDLAISCFKTSDKLNRKFDLSTDTSKNVWDLVEELMEHLPVHYQKDNSTTAIIERSPKILYDRVISYYVQHSYPVPMDATEFQRGLKERFVERDGMFFSAEQAIEYEEKKRETSSFVSLALLVGSEAEGIEWLKRKLEESPKTYSDILPDWMQDLVQPKKGDSLPELMQILEDNFLKDEAGYWHVPDINNQAQLEAVRNKRLLREFEVYIEARKIKNARLEALRAGFKECYKNKDFATIVAVGDKLPEELLTTDEILLRYYDIAASRV
ncbi:MAG: hypothetical protein IJ893_10050 [Bacteroidales bacterium]|nr:hypothetical protein [Bacteroidales bacterium]MBR6863259.1 hypothetical protein [Bacteroidales bacterium]